MINLAGVRTCDETIRQELTRTGIEIVEADVPARSEVAARLSGNLGTFTFTRAWRYWIADGFMPRDRALTLHEHPVGKDIRVAGHCGCPAPEPPWLVYFDAEGVKLWPDPDGSQEAKWKHLLASMPDLAGESAKGRFVADAEAAAARVGVDCYHIDSELGLYIFAKMVRDLEGVPFPVPSPSPSPT